MADKYKLGEELGAQVKTDVSTRAIANMEKYRPTMVVEKDGKKIEEPVSDDELNIGKQLIERAVQTGDFETVRNRAKALGVNADWFNNTLYQTQMDLARKEAALEAQTGKKASQHITAGQTMINEKTGQVIQLSTLNNNAIMTDAKTGRVLMGDAQPKLTAEEGWYKVDKTPGQAGSIAAATGQGTARGKSIEEFTTQVNDSARVSSVNLDNNAKIRGILEKFPNITGMIGQIDDPVARTFVKAIDQGIQAGNFGSISIPLEKLIATGKLSSEERDAVTQLEYFLAKGTFNAVKDAKFPGAQSEKEFAAIKEAIPKIGDSSKAIIAWTKVNDTVQELNRIRQSEWNRYQSTVPMGQANVGEFDAKFDREIAGPELAKTREEMLKNMGGKVAPSAPGSKPSSGKPSSSGLPKGYERDANGVIRKTK
jgi:hypothetical protein